MYLSSLKLFCMFPESIILVFDDGYVETPDEDGDFIGVDDLPTWTISGDSTKPTPQPVTTPYTYQPIVKGKGHGSVDANLHDITFSAAKTNWCLCARIPARDVERRKE